MNIVPAKVTQNQLLRLYNETHREQFNPDLFNKDDMSIIQALQNIILSCERDRYFTLKVESFQIVEDYTAIEKILHDHEQFRNEKSKKKDNQYDLINLKESDVKLLIVNWFIRINDTIKVDDQILVNPTDTLQVIIKVPRIINKYYFKISGNLWYLTQQIADGSTYNNSTSTNSKYQFITLKSEFNPVIIYRVNANEKPRSKTHGLKMSNGELKPCKLYSARAFNKVLNAMKFILAKYGLVGTFVFTKVGCIRISPVDNHRDDEYCFVVGNGFFVMVIISFFENDVFVQSLVATLCIGLKNKNTTIEQAYENKFWLESLASEYGANTTDKGESVLVSFEGLYDLSMQEDLMLPPQDKETVYHVLRWMLREFSALRTKDNLDISTKRIRYGKYIASLYAPRLCTAVYALTDQGSKVKMDQIKKRIYTDPNYLLNQMVGDSLLSYKNAVSDNDGFYAAKYSYKGRSGLGDGKSSVPEIYKSIHDSHPGVVDMDSSSNTDPGLSGIICPMVKLYNGSFSNYMEPNTWEEGYAEMANAYKKAIGLQEAFIMDESLGKHIEQEYKDTVKETVNSIRSMLTTAISVEEDIMNPQLYEQKLEESGYITYVSE